MPLKTSLKAGLYLVATPIGNLEDITLRALNTLKNSDIIFCEDSRISQKLLLKHNITGNLQIYNDHSDENTRKAIIDNIKQGKIISLICDAGTPLISDPGYKLVKEIQDMGYLVNVIPGACSVITALTISGLATDKFLFAGFLPKTTEAKNKIFTKLSNADATLIFFESPVRLLHTLNIAYEVFGNREGCVARELTKLYQEVKTLPLNDLIKFYQSNLPRGEIILLISKDKEVEEKQFLEQKIIDELTILLKHNITTKTATEIIADKYKDSCSKKEIYKIANKVKQLLINK